MQRTGFGDIMQTRRLWAVICLTVLMGPLVGSLTVPPSDYVRLDNEVQIFLKVKRSLSRNKTAGDGLLMNVHGGSVPRLIKTGTKSTIRFKNPFS